MSEDDKGMLLVALAIFLFCTLFLGAPALLMAWAVPGPGGWAAWRVGVFFGSIGGMAGLIGAISFLFLEDEEEKKREG